MNVLLVKPYAKVDEVIPPVGLGYLATAIRKNNTVEILDCVKEGIKLEEFLDVIKKNKFEVVGFQFYTYNRSIIKEYTDSIKKIKPEIKIIVGGPHPSADPYNVLNDFKNIDFAFIGEAEIGFPKLLDFLSDKNDTLKLEEIPGLIYRKDNTIIVNKQMFESDLDKFGFPSWDLLKPNEYPQAPHGAFFKNSPIAPIIITRGCPYHCTFCGGHLISGRTIRRRSVNHVIKEIELLHGVYGIKEIHIEDDNFTLDRKYVIEFCNKIIERKWDITLACPNGVRLDTLDENSLMLMKKAGFYSVSVGIESGSDEVLHLMKKSLNTKKIEEKIKLIRIVGLDIIGFFMIGYPGETREDIKKTINFACELDLKRANFMIFKPFPGTEIYKNLREENSLNHVDWNNFSLAKVAYVSPGFSKKELKNLRRLAFFKFYFRPKIIIKMISEIKSFEHFKYVVKRICNWLK